MLSKKPRIGFLLASIHTGSARNLWTPLVKEASRSGSAFFVFPGGRLNVVKDSEYLRNSIYHLANSSNLDGLICWGSAIGSSVPIQEVNDFHDSFKSVPYVTIAHKMKGHPCVTFDAYSGMESLVRHFITVHGTKRIAFLRGPAYHSSSMERYKAFCDVMKSFCVDVAGSPLVSDSFGWSEGEAAVSQLYHDRALIPGRDFDVLIGASDMMTFSAVRYLQKLGFKAPDDYKCGGFNDSEESRITGAAFSTVHMPYRELGLSAVSMIRSVLANSVAPCKDIVLPTHLVIRESCGCNLTYTSQKEIDKLPSSIEGLIDFLAKLFRLDETEKNAVVEPLISEAANGNSTLFSELLERALERFFEQNMDIRLLYQAIQIVKSLPFLDILHDSTAENKFILTIARIQNRVYGEARYKERRLNENLNSLKCGLLAARNRCNLMEILVSMLPKIDIRYVALVLSETDTLSRFIGGFTPEKSYIDEISFPAEQLLPDTVKGFSSGVFLVQPLFTEKQPIGYLITSVPPYEGYVFEELRSAISSALNGVFLVEQSSAARKRAETAEQAKTSFFTNVGTDLCEPLFDISKKIDQIQNLLEKEGCSKDLLSAQMVFLKTRIDEQYEKSNLILDLTLSQTDELPVEKRLFHLETVLNMLSDTAKNVSDKITDTNYKTDICYSLPLIYGDPSRLRQSLRILLDEWYLAPDSLRPERTDNGIRIVIEATHPVSESIWLKSSMMLAEKIFMLLGIKIKRIEKGCILVYPWTRFSCCSAEINAPIFEWNADNADDAEWTDIYGKRNDKKLSMSAFLFLSNISDLDLERLPTFNAVFEDRMSRTIKNPILFIGGKAIGEIPWAIREKSEYISGIEEFANVLRKIQPSLVVFTSFDCEGIEQVRKNPSTVLTPIFIIPEHIEEEKFVYRIMQIPRVILCNLSIANSEEFSTRARAILAGGEILPPDTGALVKKAVCYLNMNAGSVISRWKLADFVHVSEDYLTRIFHKETGLSPWEYLNRYRIHLATEMLLHTNATVYTVAEKCGFQDQAYFCRVFKKTTGIPPGKYRTATTTKTTVTTSPATATPTKTATTANPDSLS